MLYQVQFANGKDLLQRKLLRITFWPFAKLTIDQDAYRGSAQEEEDGDVV